MNRNHYCVILAGGIGVRIWPVSRQNKPKQFIDLLGTGETMLQMTYKRYLKFIARENIIVVVNKQWESIAREQLPDIPTENLLCEPMRRNTIPPVYWATLEIYRRNPNASIVVSPSDQNITDHREKQFEEDMIRGLEYCAEHPSLLTVGVPPSRPEVAYGYIQMAEKTDIEYIFKVQSFTEKPQEEFAKIFYESGEFLWNTGIYLWSAKTFLAGIKGSSGDMSEIVNDAKVRYLAGSEQHQVLKDMYSILPNMAIEQTLLEKAENVDVMLCHFGWADLGTWDSVYDHSEKDDMQNVLINNTKAVLYDCNDCVVRLPEGHVAVLQGLSEYVVVEQGNVIVVCKKEDQGAIRRFVNMAQMDLGEEYV